MDDIRRPHQPQRRDYTAPSYNRQPIPIGQPQPPTPQPAPPAPQPAHQPSHHQPVHHQQHPGAHDQHLAQHQPHHQTHHQPPQHQPAYQAPVQPTYQQQYEQSPAPQPAHQPYRSPSQIAQDAHQAQQAHKTAHTKPKKSPVLKIITIFVAIVTGAALIYFGYSLKSSAADNGIPQKIVQQAGFTVYFPSPMPQGYVYMKDTATFQIGQVFFRFANGDKRVTVNEQPLPEKTPNLALPGYTQFTSAIGKASVGANFGVSSAEVIAGKTLISLNTSGGVSQDELKSAINNMKNIGLSSDKKD